MNTKKNGEMEISLIHLLVEILLRWRAIILFMLIGGILFAGVSYLQSSKAIAVQQQAKQVTKEQLTEEEVANVNTLILYERAYADQLEYQEKSIVMQLDPMSVPTTEITFLIRSDDMERTYNIQKVYEEMVVGAGLYEVIQQKYGMGSEVKEVIELKSPTVQLQSPNVEFHSTIQIEMQESDTVCLVVVHKEEELCKSIADDVVKYLMEQSESLKNQMGEHELILLEESFANLANLEYVTLQKNCVLELISYKENVAAYRAALNGIERSYYEQLMNGEGDVQADASVASAVVNPEINIKLVLVGAVLFAFVYVFGVFVMYIMNNKLRCTDNVQELYNLSVLGQICAEPKKKKFMGFVDRWILAIRNQGKRQFTTKEAIGLAATAIKMAARKASVEQVYLVGCGLKESSMLICNQIQELVAKDYIQVEVLNNVIYDAEAMTKLENAKSVILVGDAGSTLYDEIAQELELFDRQGLVILGAVVTE